MFKTLIRINLTDFVNSHYYYFNSNYNKKKVDPTLFFNYLFCFRTRLNLFILLQKIQNFSFSHYSSFYSIIYETSKNLSDFPILQKSELNCFYKFILFLFISPNSFYPDSTNILFLNRFIILFIPLVLHLSPKLKATLYHFYIN
jgi:hypothetical protein